MHPLWIMSLSVKKLNNKKLLQPQYLGYNSNGSFILETFLFFTQIYLPPSIPANQHPMDSGIPLDQIPGEWLKTKTISTEIIWKDLSELGFDLFLIDVRSS